MPDGRGWGERNRFGKGIFEPFLTHSTGTTKNLVLGAPFGIKRRVAFLRPSGESFSMPSASLMLVFSRILALVALLAGSTLAFASTRMVIFTDEGGFSPPQINDLGNVLFHQGRSFPDSGAILWLERAGTLVQVMRQGDMLPGPQGSARFTASTYHALNDRNQIAVRAYIGTSPSHASYLYDGGEFNLLVANGDPAPGTSGSLGSLLRPLLLNNQGKVASIHNYSAPDKEHPFGLWVADPSALEFVGFETDESRRLMEYALFNDVGQVTYSLGGEIWYGGPGAMTSVVNHQTPIPGTISGETFRDIYIPTLNQQGEIAFYSRHADGAGNLVNQGSLWAGRPDDLRLVVQEGDAVPAIGPGVMFNSLYYPQEYNPILNNQGDILFRATVSGPGITGYNDNGLWTTANGGLRLIAREGDQAPGMTDGTHFASFRSPFLAINDRGQVAFVATVAGPEGTSEENSLGIWATDGDGTPYLIARQGDEVEVAPGDVRTIVDFAFHWPDQRGGTGNGDGRPSSFNNLGQFAFTAIFEDNIQGSLRRSQGVFVSNLVARFPELPGDYNEDGTVDAADYVLWRDGLSAPYLPHDPRDYEVWKQNFGSHRGSAANAVAVPEASTMLLAVAGLAAFLTARYRGGLGTRNRLAADDAVTSNPSMIA